MKKEVSVFDLSGLMQELNFLVPNVLSYSERYLVLPNKLGDLNRQECLAEIYYRIRNIKQAKDLFDSNQITQAEYHAKKAEILSRIWKG